MNSGVLIIGGGPAGSSAATFLARKGWPVTVLERHNFPRKKVCGEYLSASNHSILKALKVSDVFQDSAGPSVTRVGLYSGHTALSAPLPKPANGHPWGRALGRDALDALLLQRAQEAGVEILQPWTAKSLDRTPNGWLCIARSSFSGEEIELRRSVVVAAHGSWEPGTLPTQPEKLKPRDGDLFGFKAYFVNGALPEGLMPLLSFAGGYGGLVHTDKNLISLSCCIRRDVLSTLDRSGGKSAGDAVLAHILKTCPAVRIALEKAAREGDWLGTGPIRPGFRQLYQDGVFKVGNAAGEAHPVVAEGISIALQSGFLAAQALPNFKTNLQQEDLDHAGSLYARRWNQLFAGRIRTAAVFAQFAMRPFPARIATTLLRLFPSALTLCAAWSGKVREPEDVFPLPGTEARALS